MLFDEGLPEKPNIALIITDQEHEVMHWPEGWAEAGDGPDQGDGVQKLRCSARLSTPPPEAID